MRLSFDDSLKQIADSMGVALLQRFTPSEAALFLRVSIDEINKLYASKAIEYIQKPDGEFEFFGFQLLQYLLNSVGGSTPPLPKTESTDRIVRVQEVLQLTGLSRTTIWRMERDGRFPRRVALCAGSIGWRLSEVEEW